jgi:hypothetical protein
MSSTVLRRVVLMLWHAFLFLGLRLFPLFFIWLAASTAFLVRKLLIYMGYV